MKIRIIQKSYLKKEWSGQGTMLNTKIGEENIFEVTYHEIQNSTLGWLVPVFGY